MDGPSTFLVENIESFRPHILYGTDVTRLIVRGRTVNVQETAEQISAMLSVEPEPASALMSWTGEVRGVRRDT